MTKLTWVKQALLALALLAGASPALAQTTSQTFSSYISGLTPLSSLNGTEKFFVLRAGAPVTITPGQILATVAGDCSSATPPSIICTKTNGVPFAASATTDTTNADNISSGTLPAARLPYLAASATTDTTDAGNISTGTLALGRLDLATAYLYVGNGSGNPAGVAMSGDCTLASTGAVTCRDTNGVPFAASATTDTTNASNISSGTLANAREAAVNLAAGNANGGVTGTLPIANGGTGQVTKQAALNAIAPTPARAGDIMYWNGTNWVSVAGNSSGTQYLQETSAGVPSWASAAGGVTSATVAAGTGISVGGTCAITSTGTCTVSQSLTNATLQASVATPAATVSATQVMMGLGSSCFITPTYSSRVHLTISGDMYGSAAILGTLSLMFGTGTAPANGVASAGTQVGSSIIAVPNATSIDQPYSKTVIITGLTPGTTYWFDLKLNSNNGGSIAIRGNDCAGFEF